MALKRAVGIGAEICQIFVKNNMQWFGSPPPKPDLALYQTELANSPLSCVFGHAGYLINLAAPVCKNRQTSIKSLIQEIEFASLLELPFRPAPRGASWGR